MFKVFVELLPEAIFFSFFMIIAKNIKEKRVLFVSLTCLEYLLLFKAFPFSIYSKIGFFIITYIILKMLYKEKSQITDVFILAVASIIIMLSCIIPGFLVIFNIVEYPIYAVITRIVMFSVLFIFYKKINNIQKIYKKIWNRNDKIKKKIKSTTFRSANIVVFNIMFFVLNACLLFAIYFNSK